MNPSKMIVRRRAARRFNVTGALYGADITPQVSLSWLVHMRETLGLTYEELGLLCALMCAPDPGLFAAEHPDKIDYALEPGPKQAD